MAALIFIAFGGGYAYFTSQLTERTLPNTPGPSFLPWLLAIFLLVLSAGLLIQGMKPSGGADEPSAGSKPFSFKTSESKTSISGLLLFAVYLAALPFTGFLVASVPFFAGLMAISGERRKPLIAAASLGIPLFLFFLFQFVFQIPMPKNTLLE
jgi:hypothetical protein